MWIEGFVFSFCCLFYCFVYEFICACNLFVKMSEWLISWLCYCKFCYGFFFHKILISFMRTWVYVFCFSVFPRFQQVGCVCCFLILLFRPRVYICLQTVCENVWKSDFLTMVHDFATSIRGFLFFPPRFRFTFLEYEFMCLAFVCSPISGKWVQVHGRGGKGGDRIAGPVWEQMGEDSDLPSRPDRQRREEFLE